MDEPPRRRSRDRRDAHSDSRKSSRREDQDMRETPTDLDRRRRRDRSPSRGSSDNSPASDRHRRSNDNPTRRAGRPHHSRKDRSGSDDDRSSTRRDRKYRERSRSRDRPDSHHRRRRSRSPLPKRRRSHSKSPSPPRRAKAPLPSQEQSFSGQLPPDEQPVEKQKPNFKPTGLLAKEANTIAGTTTVLKYHEPPEARKPPAKEQWRLYVFKKKDLLDTVHLHQRSAWLCGRDQKVTDLLLEHPSISKQHAVIQFRHTSSRNEYGDVSSRVKPYLIDLESANGTKLNGKKVEASRYVELVDQDVLSFGDSEREYVMMLPSAEK